MLFRTFFATASILASGQVIAVTASSIVFADNLGSAVLYTADREQPGPGVIVVHEWWGLNDYAKDRAKQLAESGYTAIAVDMYGHGKVASHPTDANAFMEAAFDEPELMNARFAAAHQALLQTGTVSAEHVYGVGYCFGGAVVLNQARQGAELAGVASFHGSLGTDNPARAGDISARVLVATGGADPMVPAEQVSDFVLEMANAEVEYSLLSFPGVLHSFTSPKADRIAEEHGMPVGYDEHADKASWSALMDFIR